MTERLAGKRALVTGGGSGIGLAITRRFAAEGAAVSVCDRSSSGAGLVAGAGGSFATCDVGDAEAVQRWVADEAASLGGIDVVVAAAG